MSESASCFVQISNENIHIIRSVMDEVFGVSNFVGLISFQKASNRELQIVLAAESCLAKAQHFNAGKSLAKDPDLDTMDHDLAR